MVGREAGGPSAFQKVNDAEFPTLVKQDGNRRIVLRASGQQYIDLYIEDLTADGSVGMAAPGTDGLPRQSYPIKDLQ